jgi:uncharacterized Fe-S cluster-containing radical SAM superfamily protein
MTVLKSVSLALGNPVYTKIHSLKIAEFINQKKRILQTHNLLLETGRNLQLHA